MMVTMTRDVSFHEACMIRVWEKFAFMNCFGCYIPRTREKSILGFRIRLYVCRMGFLCIGVEHEYFYFVKDIFQDLSKPWVGDAIT